MPRKTIPQQELAWNAPEDFALIQEQAIDGERVEAEARQREKDQQESQSRHLLLFEQELRREIGE